MSRRRVGASAVMAWLVAVLLFGLLHYAASRWLLDDTDGSVRSSLLTTALWAVFFDLLMRLSPRKARREQ